MGDPTEPGEDQESTIIIEGPPEGASSDKKKEYEAQFKQFKADVRDVFKKYPTFKVKLRKIKYFKKPK
jgi:hypothetical protein